MNSKQELQAMGIKSTKQRIAILDVLKHEARPLTLNQIIDLCDMDMDLSTVYRILDVFDIKGLVVRTVPIEPSNSVYEYHKHGHSHHLICTECQLITKLETCPIGNYEEEVAEKHGFEIKRHQLELYGLCLECQSKKQ